jgi:hypothetical protein
MKRSISFLLLALGCTPEGDPNPISQTDQIDQFIQGLAPLSAAVSDKTVGPLSTPVIADNFSCSTQDILQTLRFEQLPGLAINGALFPGQILQGDSLITGGFTEAVFARNPATFSVSLSGLPNTAATMQSPTLSAFRTELEAMLSAGGDVSSPAAISFQIEEVNSQEQLNLAVGFDASLGPVQAAIDFDFSDQQKRSRALVKYVQNFYTIDLDQPGKPSDFLDSSVTLDEVQAKFEEGNPPVYVTSATVGRIIYFSAESSFSATELTAALEFAVNGLDDLGGNISLTNAEILENSSITAFVLGGDPEDAALAVVNGLDGIRTLITEGAVFDPVENPGAPIAYRLAHLSDNSPAALSFASEFSTQICERVAQRVKVTLDSVECLQQDDGPFGGSADLFGLITASSTNSLELLNRPSGQDFAIDDDQTVNLGNFGIVDVDLRATTPSISLIVDLNENDGIAGVDDYPIEARDLTDDWRGTFDINLVSGSDQYIIHFSLTPVP